MIMMIMITMTMLCSGTGMLTCVPPFLSQTLVAHTLKNYIKVAMFIFLDFTILIFFATITIVTTLLVTITIITIYI